MPVTERFLFEFCFKYIYKMTENKSADKIGKAVSVLLYKKEKKKTKQFQLCHIFFKKLHKCKGFPIISIDVNRNEEGN